MASVQALLELRNSYGLEGLAQVEFCAVRSSIYIWSTVCVCVHLEIRSPSQWNLIGRWMTAPSPVLFFRHLHLIALSSPTTKKNRNAFKRVIIIIIIIIIIIV